MRCPGLLTLALRPKTTFIKVFVDHSDPDTETLKN